MWAALILVRAAFILVRVALRGLCMRSDGIALAMLGQGQTRDCLSVVASRCPLNGVTKTTARAWKTRTTASVGYTIEQAP